jgi:hypothetical protein
MERGVGREGGKNNRRMKRMLKKEVASEYWWLIFFLWNILFVLSLSEIPKSSLVNQKEDDIMFICSFVGSKFAVRYFVSMEGHEGSSRRSQDVFPWTPGKMRRAMIETLEWRGELTLDSEGDEERS